MNLLTIDDVFVDNSIMKGALQCGAARRGTVKRGTERNGEARHRHSAARHGTHIVVIRFDLIEHSPAIQRVRPCVRAWVRACEPTL